MDSCPFFLQLVNVVYDELYITSPDINPPMTNTFPYVSQGILLYFL